MAGKRHIDIEASLDMKQSKIEKNDILIWFQKNWSELGKKEGEKKHGLLKVLRT